MHTYARIEHGAVAEVIGPLTYDDGTEIPIVLRFPAPLVATMVDITDVTPMPDQRWTYEGDTGPEATPGTFTPPTTP